VFRYLAERGFPEPFVRQRRIGYAPVSSTRDLLVRQIRSTARANGTQALREAIEAGLVVQDKAGELFVRQRRIASSPARLRGNPASQTSSTAV
jgi:hypothetical protein